jgi:hypothetical protein
MNSSSSPANRTISVTVELHPSSILHIWLKTRQEEQRQPAQIHLRNAQGGDFLLAQAQQHKEFDFHETAPGMDGQFTLDWTTGGESSSGWPTNLLMRISFRHLGLLHLRV